MNEKEARKRIARNVLRDESNFRILFQGELELLYGAKRGENIPTTYTCATMEARRVLGDKEATRICIESIRKGET